MGRKKVGKSTTMKAKMIILHLYYITDTHRPRKSRLIKREEEIIGPSSMKIIMKHIFSD